MTGEEVAMRYAMICVFASLLVWPQRVAAEIGEEAPTKSSLTVHAQHHLPPQLMLRASYYYLLDDSRLERWHPEAFKDPSSPAGEPALKLEGDSAGVEVTPTEGTAQPSKGLSRGGRIAVGVIVPLAVVGIVIGAAMVASIKNMEL
jgi:hypothetical protein